MTVTTAYRVTPVTELPYPHLLWKCDHAETHRRATASEEDSAEGRRRAFEQFVAEVGAGRIALCRKHRADWAAAAQEACAAVRAENGTDFALAPVEDDLSEAALSFFDHPVHLDGDRLGNGQHRTCALRVGGGLECPVKVEQLDLPR